MPVEDLIRYFNAADTAGHSTLYIAGDRVEAWHAGLHLGSLFQPIVDIRQERIVGHRASLQARRENGTPVASDEAYAVCETEQAVVHFDRLCRTLHALNFLAQAASGGGFLQVPVHTRHLQAVPNQHGLVYEAILKRCGLGPSDIVLELDTTDVDTGGPVAHAIDNYRQRGYRLALTAPESPLALPAVLALAPNIVRIKLSDPSVIAAVHACGALTTLDQLHRGSDYQTARRDGIDLAQGSLFGDPDASLRTHHKTTRNSYNPPTILRRTP